MEFKSGSDSEKIASTTISQTFEVIKTFQYYLKLVKSIEKIIETMIGNFYLQPTDISTKENINGVHLFTIDNNKYIIYDFSSKRLRFNSDTTNKYELFPDGSISLTSPTISAELITDMFIACSYLDKFLASFIEAVFNCGKGLPGGFKNYNNFIATCIFEEKL